MRKARERLTREAGMNRNPFDVPIPPRTTCVLEQFILYLRIFFREFELREEFYWNDVFRRHRFTAFRRKKISEERLVRKFKDCYGDGGRTKIIIGDWDGGGHTLRGQVTTKSKGFR